MKNIKDLILFKPNELIEIEGGYITNTNRLAYNYIIHRLQKEGSHYAKINISDFFNDLELGKNYEELVNYLDSLRKISVVSRDSKGKLWGAFNLLSYFKKLDNGTFYVEIPRIIFKSLCNQDKFYYTTIQLLEQKSLKYLYTPIFYEIFKKYEKINIPNFSIDELKNITGTQNKYQEYKYFKRDVLLKSIKELNKIDKNYEYSFEEKRLGRKVNEIKFIRTEKNTIDISSEPQMSEKLLNAITKARKNQYIDSVYSQKALDTILTMYEEKDIIKGLNELYKYNSEIKNFSKILISKIEDIKNSKLENLKKKKEKKQEPIEESINSTEPIESNLEMEKEKISFLILQSKYSMTQRLNLMTQLVEIHSLEKLLEFKNKI